jgi:hypothetical protein
LPNRHKPSAATHIVTLFFNPRQIAEAPFSIPPRFIRRHTSPYVLLDAHLDVKPRFFLNFTVNSLSPHKAAYSTKQIPQQSHGLECSLCCLHHCTDSQHESLPILFFHLQLFAAGAGESIETSAAVIL